MHVNYFVLAVLWIVWCAIHCGMIWITVTDALKRRFGRYFRFYRLFFNLVAIVTIIPVILYSRSLHAPVFFRWEGGAIIFQLFHAATL